MATESNKKYDFDLLAMFFGDPYTIECEYENVSILQPSVGNILEFGEKEFYQMLNVFVANPTSYRLQLWDKGIDWNKISDYTLFCMLVSGLSKDDTYLLFGDLDFKDFEIKIKQESEGEVLSLYNEKQNVEISEETYNHIAAYLRFMFNIYPKTEKAKGKTTKEWIIQEEREKYELEKNKTTKSILLPLISACLNHPGFKYKKNEIREIGISELMDSVQRIQIYENTVALNSGMYSGMCDLSKVDKKLFNFMRDINE